jgi:dihydrofolate synthase/folylpolyglutamate synthase
VSARRDPVAARSRAGRWTLADAERHLLSLELFGMRFGLDRMRRLLTALGSPQEAFASVHVVGTNGKSSTTRMTAAILAAHGLGAGAYLSPHLVSFTQRVRVGDADVAPEAFAAAVGQAAAAAAKVERTLAAGDRVTQFELLTAAAYRLLADEGVDVAVVEAGLGGRFDATNVLDSRVQVLTNVGLEHTRWLGPTVADIAREKLDVVKQSHPPGTLVVGAGLDPDALALAEATCAQRGARLVVAPADPGLPVGAAGAYQRRNFALARAAAEAFLGRLDEDAVRAAAAAVTVPGRFQVVAQRPTTILDGAHNPGGMAALAETLAAFVRGRRTVACVSILDDKDAAGMLRELLPLCAEVMCTANANPRALPPATLESLCRQLGGPPARVVADPRAALEAARAAAGEDGVAVATGSIYLVADLVR